MNTKPSSQSHTLEPFNFPLFTEDRPASQPLPRHKHKQHHKSNVDEQKDANDGHGSLHQELLHERFPYPGEVHERVLAEACTCHDGIDAVLVRCEAVDTYREGEDEPDSDVAWIIEEYHDEGYPEASEHREETENESQGRGSGDQVA